MADRPDDRTALAADRTTPDLPGVEIRVRDVTQLFHTLDPSPFRERDLAPAAEAFILDWVRQLPRGAPLALTVQVGQPTGDPGAEATAVREAVTRHFGREAVVARRRLREVFRQGRISLAIGVAFLAGAVLLANAISPLVGGELGTLLREGLIIGGWVAMWRPLELLLYDWWPILAEARLHERLAAMPVRVGYLPPET